MVWVSPGMFDTKVMVAPNSPIALAKPSTMPASTPGSASGKVMVKNTRQGAAPSVAAVAARSESRIAVHSVGESSNTWARSRGRADQEGESIFFEDRLRGRRTQEGEIAAGFHSCGRCCRDGIDDGGMGIRRKGAD